MVIGKLEANFYERNTFRRRERPSWEILLDEITGEYLELCPGTKIHVEIAPGKWMEMRIDESIGTTISGMWVKLA
jgi:hypothetical protein